MTLFGFTIIRAKSLAQIHERNKQLQARVNELEVSPRTATEIRLLEEQRSLQLNVGFLQRELDFERYGV